MARISISYEKLEDAATAAGEAAGYLAEYGSAINIHATKRLDAYTGEYTSNISSARTQAQNKIDQLALHREAPMRKLETDIYSFRDFAKKTDDDVATEITGIFNDFRTQYGLGSAEPNFIWDALSSMLPNSWVNALRGLSDFMSTLGQGFISLQRWVMDSVKDWYRYQGGKEMVETALAVVEVVVAVIALVATIISGAGIVLLVAGIISSVIAIFDAGCKLFDRSASLGAIMNGDPVWSDRYSDRADNGEGAADKMRRYSDSQVVHYIATGVDVADIACSLITIGDSIKNVHKLVQNNGGIKAMVTNAYANAKSYVSHNFVSHLKSTFSVANIKASFATYFNLASDGYDRSSTPGYHATMENLGIGKLIFGGEDITPGLQKYNHYREFSSGLRGIVKGYDRSLTNVLLTTNRFNSVAKALNPISFSNLDNIHFSLSGYEKLLGGFASVNPKNGIVSTGAFGKVTSKIKSVYKDITGLKIP